MNSTQVAGWCRDGKAGKLYNFLVYDAGDGTVWLGDGIAAFRVDGTAISDSLVTKAALGRGTLLSRVLAVREDATETIAYETVMQRVDEAYLKKIGTPKKRAQYRYRWFLDDRCLPIFIEDGTGELLALVMVDGMRYVAGPALDLQPAASLSLEEILRLEREVLGLSVSGHPVQTVRLPDDVTHYAAEVTEELSGKSVVLCGFVKALTTRTTRNNQKFAIATLEDLSGEIEVVAWPKQYSSLRSTLLLGEVVKVRATVIQKEERLTVAVQAAERLVGAQAHT